MNSARTYFTDAGYSLLEVLAVLGFLSALLLWSSMQVERVQRRHLLRRSIEQIDRLLTHKALQAISSGRSLHIFFDAAAGTLSEEEQILFQLPSSLYFSDLRLPKLHGQFASLQFSANGLASPCSIRITDRGENASCSLVQALGGQRNILCQEHQ